MSSSQAETRVRLRLITQNLKGDYTDSETDYIDGRDRFNYGTYHWMFCFEVHKEIGPWVNEKIYHNELKLLLEEKGLRYKTEKEFEVFYLTKKIGSFRVDLVVEDQVIVEIKSLAGNIPMIFEHHL